MLRNDWKYKSISLFPPNSKQWIFFFTFQDESFHESIMTFDTVQAIITPSIFCKIPRFLPMNHPRAQSLIFLLNQSLQSCMLISLLVSVLASRKIPYSSTALGGWGLGGILRWWSPSTMCYGRESTKAVFGRYGCESTPAGYGCYGQDKVNLFMATTGDV